MSYIDPISSIKMDIYPREIDKQKKRPVEFTDFFKKALYDVSDSKKYAEELNRKFMSGNLENLHDLTVAESIANFKFQAIVEVNNKLIDAYKEITRIQV